MSTHLATDFPAVRRVMGSERHRLDDDALEAILAELFPGSDPEDVEDFMGSLQRFGRQAAPVAQRALPGAISGATQGAAVAGPWGALAGAVGGGAASALSGARPSAPGRAAPPARPPSASPTAAAGGTPPPALAAQQPAVLAEPPPHAAGQPPPASPVAATAAAAQLLALLSRPETMQALQALLLPGLGRSTVQVGPGEVPPAAFANAIAETAALVAEAAALPLEEPATDYLFDSEGHARGDIANPSARAALLLSDLAAVAAAEALDDEEEDVDDFAESVDEEDTATDPLDAYEAALMDLARDE
jgi:hypothetical protein